jgi:hypothetical protein
MIHYPPRIEYLEPKLVPIVCVRPHGIFNGIANGCNPLEIGSPYLKKKF